MSIIPPPRVHDALGVLGEMVMALYGLLHLLAARDVGRAPIHEAALAAADGIEDVALACDELGDEFGRTVSAGGLCDAVERLRSRSRATLGVLAAALGRMQGERLQAKLRLELERTMRQHGAVLERQRRLWRYVLASAYPGLATLRCADVLAGGFSVRPSFAPRRVAVVLDDCAAPPMFVAEPRSVALLLDVSLQALADDCAHIAVARGEDGLVVRISGSPADASPTHVVELSRTAAPERRLAGAVAAHAGIGMDHSESGTVLRLAEAG